MLAVVLVLGSSVAVWAFLPVLAPPGLWCVWTFSGFTNQSLRPNDDVWCLADACSSFSYKIIIKKANGNGEACCRCE